MIHWPHPVPGIPYGNKPSPSLRQCCQLAESSAAELKKFDNKLLSTGEKVGAEFSKSNISIHFSLMEISFCFCLDLFEKFGLLSIKC
jgi:hypothetical protein